MSREKTLRQILEAHPDWIDLPIGVYKSDGSYDFVGGAGSCYQGFSCKFSESYTYEMPSDAACKNNKDCATCKYAEQIVVFSAN